MPEYVPPIQPDLADIDPGAESSSKYLHRFNDPHCRCIVCRPHHHTERRLPTGSVACGACASEKMTEWVAQSWPGKALACELSAAHDGSHQFTCYTDDVEWAWITYNW